MGEKVTYEDAPGTEGIGYFARPRSGGGPGVVVLQDWWTLVGHSGSVVDRLADHGFVAVAPDLTDGLPDAADDAERRALLARGIDAAAGRVATAARYLAEQPGSTGTVGLLGFGLGGSLALWTAATRPEVAAAAAFYPVVPWAGMDLEWAGFRGKAAVLQCAEEDGTSAAEGVRAVVKAIESAGGEVTAYDYPGTRHAFFNDDRPEVYDHDASSVAWARTLELFRTRLT
jgi:carboxymethylenebutenolidase